MRHSPRLNKLDLSFLINAYNDCPNKEFFFNDFFDKLAGSNVLRLSIIEGIKEDVIREEWKLKLDIFKEKREKYLLY